MSGIIEFGISMLEAMPFEKPIISREFIIEESEDGDFRIFDTPEFRDSTISDDFELGEFNETTILLASTELDVFGVSSIFDD